MNQELKFWQGTNFWIALVLLIGGAFVGFPEGEAKHAVEAIFATIAALAALRERVKGLHVDWKAWVSSKNTWNYLAALVTAIVPAVPLELFARLNDLAKAILGGNWQGIATAVFSLATILYYLIKTKPTAAKA